MGNRIVLLVPYEEEKEDYEERVAIVSRARNWYINLRTESTVCFVVESEESKNWAA